MDIATLVGIIFSIGAIGWAMYEGTGGHFRVFYSSEGFVLVLGGSLAAVCLSMPLRSVLNVFGFVKNWLFAKELPLHEIITQMVAYADLARREGVLALEKELPKQKDPFFRQGLQLTIDAMDDSVIEKTMEIQIHAMAERHKQGKKFFELMGKYGPGFGLTATLIGQVCMFQNMGGGTEAIGKALAVALLGTLYGCLISNVICGPISDKLSLRSNEEQFAMEMIMVGIRSIQAGDNPRVVEMKLRSFLSQRELSNLKMGGEGK
ncbi:MAG: MotA/TolQ/ExbB proton channel family protein [Phycisphaerae bacterium]|nr:MotA/TolQ/ExbB proton channel family protein [Phycisphaerae bacterium]